MNINQLKVPISVATTGAETSNYNYDNNGILISIDINGIIVSEYEYLNDNLNRIYEYSLDTNEITRIIEFSYNTDGSISEVEFINSENQIFSRQEYDYENDLLIEVRGYSTFNFIDFNLSRVETLEYQNDNLFKRTLVSNSIPNDIYITYQYDDKNYTFSNVQSIKNTNYINSIYHLNTNNIITESTYSLDTDELLLEDNFNYLYDIDDFPIESTQTNIDGSQPTKFYSYSQ